MKKGGKGPDTIENALRIYLLISDEPGIYTRRQIAEKYQIHVDTVDYLFKKIRNIGIELNSDGEPFYTYSIGTRFCVRCKKEKTTGSFFKKDDSCKTCRIERLSKGEKLPPYRQLMTYQQAKDWAAQNLIPNGINSFRKFRAYKKGERGGAPPPPDALPWPDTFPEFEGWAMFFGRSNRTRAQGLRRAEWPDYEEFKKIIKESGIVKGIEYQDFRRKSNVKLPANLKTAYEGWEGWKKVLKK